MTTGQQGISFQHDEKSLALQRIYRDTGINASVVAKSKTLLMFGKHESMDADVATTMAAYPAGIANEDLQTSNTITHVVSGDAGDVGDLLFLEGHHTASPGALTFQEQLVVLNGQTPVALDVPLARASRAMNMGNAPIVGPVSVYRGGPTTAGIPDDPTEVHLYIPAGENQSAACQTSIEDGHFYLITAVSGSVQHKTNGSVDFAIEAKSANSTAWRAVAVFSVAGSAPVQFDFSPLIVGRPNADIRIRGTASVNNMSASAWVNGYLAKAVPTK